jgi:hypothetical protein
MKRLLNIFLLALLTLAILFCGFIGLAIYSTNVATTPVVDLSEYTEYVGKINQKLDEGYFPETITSNAENTSFYYLPGFMQGATVMSLRLKLPESDINELIKQNENNISYSVNDISVIKQLPVRPNFGQSKVSKGNVFPNGEPLDDTFAVFLYHCTLKSINENWNHPRVSLIAISRERSEVVYLYYQG